MFSASCGSWRWRVGKWGGWGVGGWGSSGVPPTHMHTHAHTCTCMHGKHGNFMQMATPIGFWEILGIPYDVTCACMCMWVGCALSLPPTPPPGDPRNHSKFNSTWTNRDISILFKDLKFVETPPPMDGCIIWWVGGWVDGWGQVKSLKIWKLLTESR